MILRYNIKVVSLIPTLIEISDYEFNVLPVGIHQASMTAIEDTFAFNWWRRELFGGLRRGIHELKRAGCSRVYVDGSFVTSKPYPGDFDVCYELDGINQSLLNPVFLDFDDGTKAQKREFGGEFFPVSEYIDMAGASFLDFFQGIRGSCAKKGIVTVSILERL